MAGLLTRTGIVQSPRGAKRAIKSIFGAQQQIVKTEPEPDSRDSLLTATMMEELIKQEKEKRKTLRTVAVESVEDAPVLPGGVRAWRNELVVHSVLAGCLSDMCVWHAMVCAFAATQKKRHKRHVSLGGVQMLEDMSIQPLAATSSGSGTNLLTLSCPPATATAATTTSAMNSSIVSLVVPSDSARSSTSLPILKSASEPNGSPIMIGHGSPPLRPKSTGNGLLATQHQLLRQNRRHPHLIQHEGPVPSRSRAQSIAECSASPITPLVPIDSFTKTRSSGSGRTLAWSPDLEHDGEKRKSKPSIREGDATGQSKKAARVRRPSQ